MPKTKTDPQVALRKAIAMQMLGLDVEHLALLAEEVAQLLQERIQAMDETKTRLLRASKAKHWVVGIYQKNGQQYYRLNGVKPNGNYEQIHVGKILTPMVKRLVKGPYPNDGKPLE